MSMSASLPVVPSLRELLADIPDPRDPGGRRYPLVAVLLLICAGMLSGCKNPNQIAAWGGKWGPTT